jgi:hypothetical protein
MQYANALSLAAGFQRTHMLAAGGFAVYDNLLNELTCERLLSEALTLYPYATHQETWDDDYAEGRGGKPRRRLNSGSGGPVQDELYRSAWLPQILTSACGVTIVPSGNRGSYSYYTRSGDFLDLHLDVDRCDVTMITALHDNSDATKITGALLLYPGRIGEPLSAIRARPSDGVHCVKLTAGQTIVLFGGLLPHRLLPTAAGQVRIVSVLCFATMT